MALEIKCGVRLGMTGPRNSRSPTNGQGTSGTVGGQTRSKAYQQLNMHSINTRIDTSVDFDVEGSRELSKDKFSVDVSAIESASKMNNLGLANRSKHE